MSLCPCEPTPTLGAFDQRPHRALQHHHTTLVLACHTRSSSTNALLPAVYQTLPLPPSALLQQEPAASVSHSTPVPGRIKGPNMPRAPSLATPQRLQLLVPQKSSPSHSKLKCSQPCLCLCLQSRCSGCRSPVQSEAALDHPVGLHPTATCRTHPDAAETNASSRPAVTNTLVPSFSSLPAILFPIPRFPLARMTYPVFPTKKTWLVRSPSETLAVTERKHLETSLHLAHGTRLPHPHYT
ncbi:hypothetical protein COCC4DRAFT_132439 [Bipolaris maydis ATCC 48331]|uniref:Uncharacterized protein n=2 Tax=Cochliobolus heterostrophus TaxID=5016 RepID=M2V269_COCH5|nr:uncharacterized protein COCC4DRAFT_132439 [Bipolaris maydis ATCC 48331]EMD94062.1 hypothetical protein COCHEDRAFT_1201881 [Bipolaris maydis C5]ENI07636.1 hypothetical protein COCC4DRAFT_132439 [Bipolaris maydis ATCC 48331]KAJ6209516.1 hypothetical protein PSV09DRAFT_1201881 [Bipolaris maydis]